MNQAILDLIECGRQQVEAEQRQRELEQEAKQRQQEAEDGRYAAEVNETLAGIFPAELLDYITMDDGSNRGYPIFVLQLPEAHPIRFGLHMASRKLSTALCTEHAPTIFQGFDTDENREVFWVGDDDYSQTRFSGDELPRVLYAARQRHADKKRMEAEVRAKNGQLAAEKREPERENKPRQPSVREQIESLESDTVGQLVTLRQIAAGEHLAAIATALYAMAFWKD